MDDEEDYKLKGSPGPIRDGCPESILVEEKLKDKEDMTGCAGRYHHKPESFNKDVYRREDGHMLYYYY